MAINHQDKQLLRSLATRYREIAEKPDNIQRKELWQQFNDLKPQRPMVLCFPEGAWPELVGEDSLECSTALLRQFERHFKSMIFTREQIKDDNTIEPYFDIPWQIDEGNFGFEIKYTQGNNRGSHVWEHPIKNLDSDLKKLKFRRPSVNRAETQNRIDIANDIFGDILSVRIRYLPWWTMGLTWTAIKLVGLEPLMLYMYDNPQGLHRLMTFLRDECLNFITWYENENLLTHRNQSDYVGSGGVGHTKQLPQSDYKEGNPVRLKDIWGFSESQETVGVSPQMFEEFILPYQLPLLQKTGLNAYGCCEPINQRLDLLIKQVPRLRRVSVSPWADQQICKDKLQNNYIFSRKPNPASICVSFNEDQIRDDINKTLQIAGDGPLEIIMKDTHSVQEQPWRITKWTEIAKQQVGRYMSGEL